MVGGGIHFMYYAVKYTNVIFLIVGIVVMDDFFFLRKKSMFQDLHCCKLK